MKKTRKDEKHELLVAFYSHLQEREKPKKNAPVYKRIISVLTLSLF